MAGTTVFVSSRMDELAFERRSAFDALFFCGLTPLLFETEPLGSSEKDMIDSLVDRADHFVGIYYQTIGRKSEHLYDLEPIAYELYRFLLRFCDTTILEITDGKNLVNEEVKKELKKRLAPQKKKGRLPAGVERLLRQIRDGRFRDVLDQRVHFFIKTHPYDTMMSVGLARFLSDFPNIPRFLQPFQSGVEDGPSEPKWGQGALKRYVTARLALHESLQRKFSRLPSAPDPEGAGSRPEPRFHWRVEGPDLPGTLFHVLEVFFAQAFNIDFLCSERAPQGRSDYMALDIVSYPFLTAQELDRRPAEASKEEVPREIRVARSRLGDAFRRFFDKGWAESFRVEVKPIPSWPAWDCRPPEIDEGELQYFFRVETADVPGQVLRLTERVFLYEGSLRLLYFDSRYPHRPGDDERLAETMMVCAPAREGSKISERIQRSMFESEVRQGLGVYGIQELTRDAFETRMNEIKKKIRAGEATATGG